MVKYEVKHLENAYIVEAKTSDQAKRKVCHMKGISPSDAWLGISTMSAKRINEEKPRR